MCAPLAVFTRQGRECRLYQLTSYWVMSLGLPFCKTVSKNRCSLMLPAIIMINNPSSGVYM